MPEAEKSDAVLSLIKQLEQSAPIQGAAVSIKNLPDDTLVIANKAGLLKLGLEIMKAAFAAADPKHGGEPDSIPVALDDFVRSDEPLLFRRVQQVPEAEKPTFLQRRIMPAIFLAVILVILLLSLAGLGFIGRWLFS